MLADRLDGFELSQAMIAGGTGGTCGDMLMHSLDTVKTRQQGDPHFPPKYTSMTASYATIYRQEGILRGLYGGVTPALIGSFPGTVIFFGVYEFTKRQMLDRGVNPSVAYLSGGKPYVHYPVVCVLCAYINKNLLSCRLPCRPRCLDHLCPLRGVENTTTAPGTVQQPILQFRI